VVESVVQAAHFVPSMRGGVVVKEGEGGTGMDAMKGREGMEGGRPPVGQQEGDEEVPVEALGMSEEEFEEGWLGD
jgi:hypothetical protein